MNQPNDFRYISEDRRRAMLDRRASDRGSDRRQVPTIPYHLKLVALETHADCAVCASGAQQETIAAELRSAGMFVR